MARSTGESLPPSRWTLVDCPTNARVWNPRWRDTRGLSKWARRGSVIAVNSFGTVRLFDVAEPRDVRVLGALKLPELTGNLPEDLAIGFDRDGHVVQASGEVLHVVDIADPMQPRLVATHPIAPPFRDGTFVDGVLYRSAKDDRGMYAHDGTVMTTFAPKVEPYLAPYKLTRVGEFLYAFGGADDVDVYQLSDLSHVVSKQCSVGYDVDVLHAPEIQIVVASSAADTHILDVANPKNPKRQKKLYKHSARGAGIAGTMLYLVDGEYQEDQSLTVIQLGRPSTIVSREAFTTDPELGSGLLCLERSGDDLWMLTSTGRFAVLTAR